MKTIKKILFGTLILVILCVCTLYVSALNENDISSKYLFDNEILQTNKEVINESFDEQAFIEDCSGTYGYTYLGTSTKGEAFQTLYNRMANLALEFHTNKTINAGELNVLEGIQYSDLGLSREEALLVWKLFKYDHPIYYWISMSARSSNSSIYLVANENYANGETRIAYNEKVYSKINEFVSGLDSSNAYDTAIFFHDLIISKIDYSYGTDGKPETAEWAHSIEGVIEGKGGVCEAYSKTFNILLNLQDIENIVVTGTGNTEAHMWNLAKMDDGNWYWFDLTWDDSNSEMIYSWFCKNDTSDIDSKNAKGKNFLNYHTLDSVGFSNTNMYSVPSRAVTSSYDIEYNVKVNSNDEAYITYYSGTDTQVTVPSKLYNKDVVAIDSMAFMQNTSITKVILPNGLKQIGEGAFYECSNLVEVLFPDSIIAIGDYAFANCMNIEKLDLPENLVTIDQYAFAGCISLTSINFPCKLTTIDSYAFLSCVGLTKVTLSSSIETIGENAFDSCIYLYKVENNSSFTFTMGSDEYGGIAKYALVLTQDGKPTIADSYSVSNDNFLIYNLSGSKYIFAYLGDDEVVTLPLKIGGYAYGLHCFHGSNNVVIPEGVTFLTDYAFANCTSLKSITIPGSIAEVGEDAFYNCQNLKIIYGERGSKGETIANELSVSFIPMYKHESVTITDENKILDSNVLFIVEEIEIDNIKDITLANKNKTYDIHFELNSQTVNIDDYVLVKIKIPNEYNVQTTKVYYLDSNNNKTLLDVTIENGYFVFAYNKLGKFAISDFEVIKGDLNGDGVLDNKDAVLFVRYLSKESVTIKEELTDVNGDTKVNNKDLMRLFQKVSGWDVELY